MTDTNNLRERTSEAEQRLMAKYKCTASANGGWCDGIAVGSRLQCPQLRVCKDKSRACNLGIERGLEELLTHCASGAVYTTHPATEPKELSTNP